MKCLTWIVLPVVAAAVCLSTTAHADRATAEFHAARADKALSKKKWEEAEDLFRKALSEDETFLPARAGLANALLGSNQKTLAIEELRRVAADALVAKDVPSSWGSTIRKSGKLLAKFDELGNAYEKIINDHINALMSFANRWKSKDPEIATTALKQVLQLAPEHVGAQEALIKLGKAEVKSGDPLFNGKDLEGWMQMSAPTWTIEDGILRARPGADAYGGRTLKRYKGNFNLLVEARMIEKTGRVAHFAFAVMTSHSEKTAISFLKGRISVLEYANTKEHEEPFDETPERLGAEVNKWTTYEMRLRDSHIHFLVNGKEVFKMERRSERDSGYIGLIAQAVAVDIKRVELLQK